MYFTEFPASTYTQSYLLNYNNLINKMFRLVKNKINNMSETNTRDS